MHLAVDQPPLLDPFEVVIDDALQLVLSTARAALIGLARFADDLAPELLSS